MIPYDDLVAALAAWRTRQGLPTGQIAAPAPAAPPKQAAPAPAAAPAGKRPASQPGRAASPARAAAVMADPTGETSIDVDEAALLEESSDFAMSFDGSEVESTPVGGPPAPRRGR